MRGPLQIKLRRILQYLLLIPSEKQLASRNQYQFLDYTFLKAMNEIGQYGHVKYAEESYHHRATLGDRSRGSDRTSSQALADHAGEHFQMYLRGELHDHFRTRRHQLAAVAFNSMMEFYFAGLKDEE